MVVAHGGQSCFDWFVVVCASGVDGVVVGAAESCEYAGGEDDCLDVGPSVSFHQYLSYWS